MARSNNAIRHRWWSRIISPLAKPTGCRSSCDRIRVALIVASDRVQEKYGFACSRAMGQLAKLEAAAGRFDDSSGDRVTVISFHE
jgi:hypothetical protein